MTEVDAVLPQGGITSVSNKIIEHTEDIKPSTKNAVISKVSSIDHSELKNTNENCSNNNENSNGSINSNHNGAAAEENTDTHNFDRTPGETEMDEDDGNEDDNDVEEDTDNDDEDDDSQLTNSTDHKPRATSSMDDDDEDHTNGLENVEKNQMGIESSNCADEENEAKFMHGHVCNAQKNSDEKQDQSTHEALTSASNLGQIPSTLPAREDNAKPSPNTEAIELTKANGVANKSSDTQASNSIVELDDSDDDDLCESEKSHNESMISNDALTNVNMSKNLNASESDEAYVIGSDSEPEITEPTAMAKPTALISSQPVNATRSNQTIIDDDDDDCVVIEDDPPAPLHLNDSKRKFISDGYDVMPPIKRQRSLTPSSMPTQLTIKDARTLMSQDIMATNVKKENNIYPITITSAGTTTAPAMQGPPKLVPMSTPVNMGLNAITGLQNPSLPNVASLSFSNIGNISTNNANLLPGLTDDMFVLEAPSFIVPYIYEKPPSDNIKEIIKELETKYSLTPEDLAEADKSDEFDMITEQNKEVRSEVTAAGNNTNNKKKRRNDDGDDSWSEQTDDDDDDDDDDSESGVRTKVLIKEASDDLSAFKGAIKPAAALAQSITTTNANSKSGQENYFESPLGKFFMDIGVGQVQEYVQADLLRLQKRKMRKMLSLDTKDFELAINALSGNLQASRTRNAPYKFTLKRCEFCNFKSESALAMANHYETPHMNGVLYKCNFCIFEIRNATEIVYHMEAVHNIKARLIKPLPYHQCPNCGFEDNGKAKLARHQPVCAKKFRPEINLAPPADWEAPAKIPRIKPRHGLVGTATAYQAMAAQAAAQKAAIATLQAQQAQQMAQARSMQAAALAAQNAAKFRQRPPSSVPKTLPTVGNTINNINNTNIQRGPPSNVRNPVSTNVVLPNNYQIAAGQLVQQAGKKPMSGQPSISITPLPRQNASSQNAIATTSKSPGAGMKPGQNTGGPNHKAQFVICEICDGYIKDLEQLRNHMQWMHKVKIHPKMIYNRPPLNCQKCQFRFFTDQGLERHLLGSHGLVTSSMQEAANKGKDAGRCPICGRMYQWKLLNHVSRDHHMTLKPAHLSYKCTVCTATFGMYKQFETHVYTAHSTVAKKATDGKKSNNVSSSSSSSSSGNVASSSLPRSAMNESLLKPLKINDEITIIPQPASKSRITNMESHVID